MSLTSPFSFHAARTSLVLLAATAALAGCASGGDGDRDVSAAPAPTAPQSGLVAAYFRAHLQPSLGKMTIERLGAAHAVPDLRPEDFTDLPIVADNVAGSGPANTVELVTNSVGYNGQCPAGFQTNTFCGNVTLDHFYGLKLSNVFVQVTKVTDTSNNVITGHSGINNDSTPLGLTNTDGLWQYTSSGQSTSGIVDVAPNNSATRDWVFANPDNADTYIYLRSVGSLYPTVWFMTGQTAPYVSAPLQAGQPAIYHYEFGRLTNCRGSNWQMAASFFGSNNTQHTMTFPGSGSTNLDLAFMVPFGGTTSFYVHNFDGGCSVYDSNGGGNYNVGASNPSPVIHYKSDYSTSVTGSIAGGGNVTIDYDMTRFNFCFNVDPYDRVPSSASPTMYYRFGGGAFTGVALSGLPYGVTGTGQLQVSPTLAVPAGSHQLEVYFQAANGGSPCYDSNLGNNYFTSY
jgi:Family of unknown function (DUF6209)